MYELAQHTVHDVVLSLPEPGTACHGSELLAKCVEFGCVLELELELVAERATPGFVARLASALRYRLVPDQRCFDPLL